MRIHCNPGHFLSEERIAVNAEDNAERSYYDSIHTYQAYGIHLQQISSRHNRKSIISWAHSTRRNIVRGYTVA